MSSNWKKLPTIEDFEALNDPALKESVTRVTRAASAASVSDNLTRRERIVSWTCRLIASAIMAETLFFKFTGAPESIYIFTKLAMESWWRYGQGVWELAAVFLLLMPRTAWAGGIVTLGAIGAAIISHLTILGIEVQGDHGLLFGMAVVTFCAAAIVTWLHRDSIPFIAPRGGYF